jgi:hypothetical protein
MISKGMNAMPALLKILVLLAIFLLASNANAFTSLSPVAGSQVQENHFKQFETVNGIDTSYMFEAVNGVNTKQFEAVNGINTSYTFEAVNGVNAKQFETVHGVSRVLVKYIVTKQVTFNDKRDDEIQSKSSVECNSRPNEWRMPDKIDLDSSGLRRFAWSAVASR